MKNDSVKQPTDQPKREHGSQGTGRSPKKRTFLLVILMVVILLVLGGVVVGTLLRGKKAQIQENPLRPGETAVANSDTAGQNNGSVDSTEEDAESIAGHKAQNKGQIQTANMYPVEEFRYILQPAVCCVLIAINLGITLLLVNNKLRLFRKENPTQKLLKDLRNNMSKWKTKLNEIHIETNLIKNEDLNTVMFKLGSISEKIETLASEINSDRDKIPG